MHTLKQYLPNLIGVGIVYDSTKTNFTQKHKIKIPGIRLYKIISFCQYKIWMEISKISTIAKEFNNMTYLLTPSFALFCRVITKFGESLTQQFLMEDL